MTSIDRKKIESLRGWDEPKETGRWSNVANSAELVLLDREP